MTFPELAVGMMYFKENDKVPIATAAAAADGHRSAHRPYWQVEANIEAFVNRNAFKVAVIKMFDTNDNQVTHWQQLHARRLGARPQYPCMSQRRCPNHRCYSTACSSASLASLAPIMHIWTQSCTSGKAPG